MAKQGRRRWLALLLLCGLPTGCIRGFRPELHPPPTMTEPPPTLGTPAPTVATEKKPANAPIRPGQHVTGELPPPQAMLPPPPPVPESQLPQEAPAPPVRLPPDTHLSKLPAAFTEVPVPQGAMLPHPSDVSIPPPPNAVPAVPTAMVKEEPLVEAVRAILLNRHDDAVKHLKAYGENEEVLLRLLPVLAMMAKKPLRDLSPEESAALNGQFESIVELLRPRTELMIKKMACCEWVKAYGVYKPLPPDHVFLAASRNCPGELVQIYAEIGNISAKKQDGGYVTQLSTSVEIRDRKGNQGYYRRFGGAQPLKTLTPLHDYYNTYSFYVPNNMPPGVYTLTIHVTDETFPERRLASKSIEFRVSGLPSMPNN